MFEFECLERAKDLKDREALVGLIVKQMDVIKADAGRQRAEHALDSALGPEKRTVFFLCRGGSTLAGFAFGNICSGLESGGDYLWLNELYIDAPYRRKGGGKGLLEYIERWATRKGIGYMAFITGLKNDPARRFYESRAFDCGEVVWVDKKLN